MTDVELRDELMTLLTAGHETTATGLSWAFERLLRTPRVLERLLGSLDDDEYLDAVVKETLRVRPVIADVARVLKQPIVLGGYALPAGTLVLPAIAAVHMRPDLYPEPHEFRPERFLDGGAESYAWIPFGGGVRRCIGASFAQVEMRVVHARGAEAGDAARRLAAARARQGPARDGGAGARLPRDGRGAACARAELRARPARAARRPGGRGRRARRRAPAPPRPSALSRSASRVHRLAGRAERGLHAGELLAAVVEDELRLEQRGVGAHLDPRARSTTAGSTASKLSTRGGPCSSV